jgi:hypothetical protein
MTNMIKLPAKLFLIVVLLSGQALAQAQPDAVVPARSIQITAEQGHVIKETVLKDGNAKKQTGSAANAKIGDKAPAEASLQSFPPEVVEKVPQVRTHRFFIAGDQVVIVSTDGTVADILK